MIRIVFCMLALTMAIALYTASPAAAGQTVIIDSDVNNDIYGNGNLPNGSPLPSNDPNDNKVIINNGAVIGDIGTFVYGGYASIPLGGTGTVNGNSVVINGGYVGSGSGAVYGGYAASSGGTLTANGNSVVINGGEVRINVYGGHAYTDGGIATANGNSVFIGGGQVGYIVYGGYADSDDGTATATHNTVTISGSPTFDGASTGLVGGVAIGSGTPDFFTGNTLNVWNYTGTAVWGVQNFEYYNFILPASPGNAPALTAANVRLGDGTTGSTVTGVSLVGGAAPVQPGDEVTLIAGNITGVLASNQAQGLHGATLAYDWTLDTASGLGATLKSVQARPQTKALAESYLGGLALTTQGADLVAGPGLSNAVNAVHGTTYGTKQDAIPKAADEAASLTDGEAADGSSFVAFGALSGSSMRYNSSSYVDMNSLSLLAGLAKGWGSTDFSAQSAIQRLTLGAFFEYGNGSYDTHNSFSNAASVDGDGDAHYLGGGILGRLEFAVGGHSRQESGSALSKNVIYAEASARMGQIRNEYNTSDLQDALGRSAKGYESSSLYYGLHFGTGYLWNITEAASLDLYGKYFWTRQEGDSVTLATGDPVKFNDADSHRLRLGGRFAYSVNEFVSPYIGAAYEHEFDGKARASAYGYSIDAPALRGDTGIGEIGLSLKPSQTTPLSFDLGLQGYTGKREGVTGSLQLRFEF